MRGVHDRHAAARHPTLATVSVSGLPQARTVVLRSADRANGTLDFHTDVNSAKVEELRANAGAALHVWDSRSRLQIRLAVNAAILTGPAVAADWARVPESSRISYGVNPAPGQPIPGPLAYDRQPDVAGFAVIRLQVQQMDVLHLGEVHRRAHYRRSDHWLGQWLAP